MAAKEHLDIGVVGAGGITSYHHLPILKNTEGVELSYIADVDGSRAKRLARRFGGAGVEVTEPADLPGCDIALIATPVGVRKPYLDHFGDRGAAVFAEKPFAPDLTTHEEFLELTGEVLCNYMRRKYSAINQVRTAYQAGTFGELRSISIEESIGTSGTGRGKNTYQTDPALSGGGILIESGSHTVSQLTHAFKDLSYSVEEASAKWVDDIEVHTEARLSAHDDSTEADVEYKLSSIREYEPEMRVRFESAELRFDHTDPEATITVETGHSQIEELSLEREAQYPSTVRAAFYGQWQKLLDVVSEHGETSYQKERATGLRVSSILTEIYGEIHE